ncbi:MAG: haloalkane dehalogenase [Thermoleophilaceae bacterium]
MSAVAEAVRTADERFEGLPGFDFALRRLDVDGMEIGYVDEGDGQPILMLHGQPTWSYLFRRLIPPLRDAGYRCVALDYPGFGRSDKPVDLDWYTYDRHTDFVLAAIEQLGLQDVILCGHDWGGPIGLRLAVEHPERFDRYVLMDTPFFTGRQTMPPVWWQAREVLERDPDVPVGDLVRAGCRQPLADAAKAAYDAPFPDVASKAGARAFPLKVLPLSADLPAAKACWRVLKSFRKDDTKPALILWGAEDVLFPFELGQWVAGALRREGPVPVEGASHYLPEDRGEEAARLILEWLG